MILVCGEALVDLFVGEDDGAALAARAAPGGSPFNVAIALARLGAPAGFCGGLGSDRFGDMLAGRLAREGVEARFAPRLDAPTTVSVVAPRPGGDVSYAFHGAGAADRVLSPEDLPAELPDDVAALAFGSFSIAVEPAGSAYLGLARREAARRVVSLDPNLRPKVTPDLAAWRARFAEFLVLADVVKASAEDVEGAFGVGAAGLDEIALDWLAAGPRVVAITLGAEGALGFLRTSGGVERVRVPGRRVAVADTVGAGDTLHAALLARLRARSLLTKAALPALDRAGLEDALGYAVAAASLTCARPGADPPRAREVEAALAERPTDG